MIVPSSLHLIDSSWPSPYVHFSDHSYSIVSAHVPVWFLVVINWLAWGCSIGIWVNSLDFVSYSYFTELSPTIMILGICSIVFQYLNVTALCLGREPCPTGSWSFQSIVPSIVMFKKVCPLAFPSPSATATTVTPTVLIYTSSPLRLHTIGCWWLLCIR